MTEFEEMMIPKNEDVGLPYSNQFWTNNQPLPSSSAVEVDRYVMFDETNLLEWNDSRYAAQQASTRNSKRRSSPANLQTQQLKLGYIMEDLHITDDENSQDMNIASDLMLNPESAAFDPGFIQRLPINDDFIHPQKFMESWGPMISGVAAPVCEPHIGNSVGPLDPAFSRRHSIAVTGYDWRSHSPELSLNQNTVEPKYIHDMNQIPCVLAPTPNKDAHFQPAVDPNVYQFPLNPMSRQYSQPIPASVSPSSDVISSAGSMTPTPQPVFNQDLTEATPASVNDISSEGYTFPSRKRSIVTEIVDNPIFNLPIDIFQSPTDAPTDALRRKRTKSIDFGVLANPVAFSEAEAYEYPLMTQEDMEKADNDQNARPRRQRLRYPEDCYTPKWVRYSGQAKEGYCDSCQPGKWLQLKNSAYWYHKQFYHGISSVSGRHFMDPIDQRWGDQDAIEGLCHQCRHWISICTSKRKNSVLWYRHAHKCHIYHKPKPSQAKRRPSVQF